MRYPTLLKVIGFAVIVSALTPGAGAEDIDLFAGPVGVNSGAPNVLFVIDNTANWASKQQGWPDGLTQGQAEMRAIRQVVSNLDASINVGVMMLSPTTGIQGGMVPFAVQPMNDANRAKLITFLDQRYDNITDPNWKASTSASYGSAMFDAFKYFGGFTSPANANLDIGGTPDSRTHFRTLRYSDISSTTVDPSAYNTDLTRYMPPGSITACGKNYIVFIGNAFPSGGDDKILLKNVGGNTTPIQPNPMDSNGSFHYADEWTRFLYLTDVSAIPGQQNVVTYTIDVFANKFDAIQSQYLKNMALAGGGTPFTARTNQELVSAIQKVLVEVQAVNNTFASASIPVNTANRAQGKNQVFIPLFRPDPDAKPRWFGNLKQYQLIDSGGTIQLGDVQKNIAVNFQTGFFTDCSTSFWTTDSGDYWSNVPILPSPRSNCPTTPFSRFSDAPDGPTVEKGGVAEVIRKGNNPVITNATPTWTVNRTILTQDATGLTPFTALSSGLAADIVAFISGHDVNDEDLDGNVLETRVSLHGDAIHSRPLPVDYGTSGVTVFYGANDGMLRAVDASNGRERWAFIAPEFFKENRLARLKDNSPLVSNYFAGTTSVTPLPIPKGYFFDGSIGLHQTTDNSRVWIYPTMRRGGRMIYGFNVTNPGSPTLLWKAGCPNFADDIGCTTGLSNLGQTWSKPMVASEVAGYGKRPVVVLGGGYDRCEDANIASPSCVSPKGAGVYVFDAQTGALLKSFPTIRSVVADVALASTAVSGVVDVAYVADMGGNIYRVDFKATLDEWTMTRIAYTNGSGRKFMNAPALLVAPSNKIYLALGSGDREKPLYSHYPYTGVVNRFYVLLDDLSGSLTNLDDVAAMSNVTVPTSCTDIGVLPSSRTKGWFMDLNQYGTGEQTVTSAVIASGMIAFSTHRPISPTASSCTTTLGEARGYWVNLFNGSGSIGTPGTCGGARSSLFASGGLAPTPVIGTVPINGVPRTVVIGAAQKNGGASSTVSPQSIVPTALAKRKTVYWKSSNPK